MNQEPAQGEKEASPMGQQPAVKSVMDCPPFTQEVMQAHFQFSICPEASITVVTGQIIIPAGIHTHDEYEFFLPLTCVPVTRADHRLIETRQNQVMPYNSGQSHGSPGSLPGRFLCLHLPSHFVREIIQSAFSRSSVVFRNEGIPYTTLLQRLFSSFVEEARNREAGYWLALQGLSLQMALHLLRRGRTDLPAAPAAKDYNEDKALERAIDYMMAASGELSLEEAARAANLSRFHFIRVFKRKTGQTPWEYLTTMRIERACVLLKRSGRSVANIAQECGFGNSSYFATVFKRAMGVTPSEYRRAILLPSTPPLTNG